MAGLLIEPDVMGSLLGADVHLDQIVERFSPKIEDAEIGRVIGPRSGGRLAFPDEGCQLAQSLVATAEEFGG